MGKSGILFVRLVRKSKNGGEFMANNDEWGDIFSGEPENSTTEKVDTGNNGETENVKPVKLGRMATAGIVVALLVVVLIAIITIRGCTIEKKQNSNQTQGTIPIKRKELQFRYQLSNLRVLRNPMKLLRKILILAPKMRSQTLLGPKI